MGYFTFQIFIVLHFIFVTFPDNWCSREDLDHKIMELSDLSKNLFKAKPCACTDGQMRETTIYPNPL